MFAVCASRMIAYGPQKSESGAHLPGFHAFIAPSGMWIVTGTHTSCGAASGSSSSSMTMSN